MHPILMRSDFDPVQVAIVVLAVIIGFIKWLWEGWQQKREAAKREVPPDPEEQRRRAAAWRKQTGQNVPPPIPQSPSPAPASSWGELRKAWAELKDAAREAQTSSRQAPAPAQPARRPPPVPQQHQPVRSAVAAAPAAQPDPATMNVMLPPAAAVTAPMVVRTATPNSMLTKLRGLRRDPALMRQAILMQEILGPPKALQTSNGPAI
jgi:hypothetical protein